ncbi:MAG: ATP-binding cassette domain-containing protein [Bacteroidales bacterium]|jgi:molybdopterin-binding protein|nr:ATP-binding cassette domain-containing protein [Bacteroidales bacterium]
MLELKNISKTLGSFQLQNISITVEAHDYFVVVGASGAGKSQLLELIAGMSLPDSGSITLNGLDITQNKMQKRDVGMVFQDYAIFPHMTVAQNIAYPLQYKNLSKSQINLKVKMLAEDMAIDHLLDRNPAELSGGEQQRTALARTLALDPKILLLDEPLSNVDIRLKYELRRLLRKINKKGIPIVHVTHDFEDAIVLATKVAVIKDGRIIQTGHPTEVFLHPASDFIAKFAGVRNFFRSELIDETGSGLKLAMIKNHPGIHVVTDETPGEGSIIIPASDIFLSNQKTETSARNQFKAQVCEVFPSLEGMEVIVDCGIKLAVLVSRSSVTEMNIVEGRDIWISFKASSVQFIKG